MQWSGGDPAEWFIDGTQDANTDARETSTAFGLTRIGTRLTTANLWDGLIGEIIVLDEPTEANRQRIEGYLAWKWGLTGNLPDAHPYKTFPPQKLWTPEDTTTQAWWDASDNTTITESSGSVSQWDNKGLSTATATQGTGANQPSTGTRTINGLNVLNFVNDSFEAGGGNISIPNNQISIFAVIEYDGSSNLDAAFFDFRGPNPNATSRDISLKTTTLGQFDPRAEAPNMQNMDFATTNVTGPALIGITVDDLVSAAAYLNGNQEATATPTFNMNGAIDTFRIMANLGNIRRMNGAIAEIVIIDNVETDTRQLIEGYLAHKWGLTANLPTDHPYKSSPPLAES